MNTAMSIEERFLEVLSKADRTADEVAEEIGEHLLAVRPTATNLKTQGIIIRTGEKRRNSVSGKYAHVLTIRPSASNPTPTPKLTDEQISANSMVKQAKEMGYLAKEMEILFGGGSYTAEVLAFATKQAYE